MSEEELDYESGYIQSEVEQVDRALSMSHLSGISSVMHRPASRAPSSVATTTVIHLHQPKERRGNAILYDKTPTATISVMKVAYFNRGLISTYTLLFTVLR